MKIVWRLLAGYHNASILESRQGEGGVSIFKETKSIAHLMEIAARDVLGISDSGKFLCESEIMRLLVNDAGFYAQLDSPVLITGETGTGKELIARMLHDRSRRKSENFVPVNCAAIPGDSFEAEFFGHRKGAYTGADFDRTGYIRNANKGTLFLDEIGEMPLSMQVKLLRVLQDGEVKPLGEDKYEKVDFRLVAATNVDLDDAVDKGRFREDLFYRIAISRLHCPPLRERGSKEILLLADNYLKRESAKYAKTTGQVLPVELTDQARGLLASHPWPGNIRKLQSVIHQAAVKATRETAPAIDAVHIQPYLTAISQDKTTSCDILNRKLGDGFNLKALLKEIEHHYIERAIAEAGNQRGRINKVVHQLLGGTDYMTATNLRKIDKAYFAP